MTTTTFSRWVLREVFAGADAIKFIGLPDGRVIFGRGREEHESIHRRAGLEGDVNASQENNVHGWLMNNGEGGFDGLSYYSYKANAPVIGLVIKSLEKTGKVGDFFVITPQPMEGGAPSKAGMAADFMSLGGPIQKATKAQQGQPAQTRDIERDRFNSTVKAGGMNPSRINRVRTHPDYGLPREHFMRLLALISESGTTSRRV